MRLPAAFLTVWRLPQAHIFLLDAPLGSRHWKEELWCLSWSAADLCPQEIIQGAFVEEQANPFLHLSRLQFVHTVSEMQNNWNLCFHGAAFFKLAYFFTGNFC